MSEPSKQPTIYTLGHSRHSFDDFAALTKRHSVDMIVDVRGQPWSRSNPQFNRETFQAAIPNWTGRLPVRGWPLAGLALL